jgi:hypothetical protein
MFVALTYRIFIVKGQTINITTMPRLSLFRPEKGNDFAFIDADKANYVEYYDLIYEYKNDCLIAGIKYNKTFYKDRDLEPTEDFMFSIKLIPLTALEQKFAN